MVGLFLQDQNQPNPSNHEKPQIRQVPLSIITFPMKYDGDPPISSTNPIKFGRDPLDLMRSQSDLVRILGITPHIFAITNFA